jgi:hypothetical protein
MEEKPSLERERKKRIRSREEETKDKRRKERKKRRKGGRVTKERTDNDTVESRKTQAGA